jgi:hypothetical protein
MPSSRYDIIPFVLDRVMEYNPKSILDIGIGFGKWGVLFREYLDIWNTKTGYKDRQVEIIGIEGFSGYKNSIWKVYDKVYIGSILDMKEITSKEYDLIFMGDVIEHFTKKQGLELLSKLKYKNIIIITPGMVSPQQAVYNNLYEVHKSEWTQTDLDFLNHYQINNQQVFYS